MNKSLSQIIKDNLVTLGISQNELARRSGISKSLMSYYVNGKCLPSVKNLKKISKALSLDIESFM